jgi:hypothetical protein
MSEECERIIAVANELRGTLEQRECARLTKELLRLTADLGIEINPDELQPGGGATAAYRRDELLLAIRGAAMVRTTRKGNGKSGRPETNSELVAFMLGARSQNSDATIKKMLVDFRNWYPEHSIHRLTTQAKREAAARKALERALAKNRT